MAPSCPPTIQKRRVRPTGHANALRFAFAALIAGCALPNRGSLAPRAAPTDAPAARGSSEIAIASWYGREFHGRRTASGEVFDQHGLSAAHPTLPLGTRVRVTSLTTGESVDVRITDRGPFVKGRTLDLSYGAARRLRMLNQGTGRVRIEVLTSTSSPIGKSRRAGRERRGTASVKLAKIRRHQ
jgi:rare lipoprotein A